MATTVSQALNTEDIAVSDSYSLAISGVIDSKYKQGAGIGLLVDSASTVSLMFKAQVKINDQWHDLYREIGGVFELEEYTLPLQSGVSDQRLATRFVLDGIRETRLVFKTGAGTATIKEIYLTAEQEEIRG